MRGQAEEEEGPGKKGLRERIWRIIFEAETPTGRVFDVLLILLIVASVATVMLESIESVQQEHGSLLHGLEWCFTILFTIEYVLRLCVVRRPLKYATSFFGVIDLLSCLPMYLGLFLPVHKSLLIIRIFRMLRIFRVLKMVRHVEGSRVLLAALYSSRQKITVFFFSVVIFTVLAGSLMYLIEGRENGFVSIPASIYWAIVTISTVGFGDITPRTPLGQFVTSVCILIGYAIIAVPTGIISSELSKGRQSTGTYACHSCGAHGHLVDARYCRKCGEKL